MERRPQRNGYQRRRNRGAGGGQDGARNTSPRIARESRELREQREAAELQAQEQVGESQTLVTLAELEGRNLEELHEMARELDITGASRLRKQDLAFRILQAQTEQEGNIFRKGVLDVMPDGFGFLRLDGYLPGPNDIYVSQSQVRRSGLRMGDEVVGQVRQAKEGEKYLSLLRVDAVNGVDVETAKKRPNFSD